MNSIKKKVWFITSGYLSFTSKKIPVLKRKERQNFDIPEGKYHNIKSKDNVVNLLARVSSAEI